MIMWKTRKKLVFEWRESVQVSKGEGREVVEKKRRKRSRGKGREERGREIKNIRV